MNFTKDFIENMISNSNIGKFISYFSAIQIFTSLEEGVYYFIDRFISGETKYYAIGLGELDKKLIQHVLDNYRNTNKDIFKL